MSVFKSLLLVAFGAFILVIQAQNTNSFKDSPTRIGILLPYQSQFQKTSELTELMLDYSAGFTMALEDLKSEGFPVNAMVDYYDSDPSDSTPINNKLIKSTLATLATKNYDVLIGPVYEQNFKTFSSASIPRPQLHVSPLKYLETKGLGATFNFFLSDSLKAKAVAHTVGLAFNKYTIFIITDGKPNNTLKAESMKSSIDLLRGNKSTKIIGLKANGTLSINKKDSCVLIVCSEDTKYRGLVSAAVETHTNSWVIGDISWFEDKRFYQNQNQYNCLYPTVNYVDLTDSLSVDFAKRYFRKELTEPSRFSYIGYDQARYLLSNYMYSQWENFGQKSASSNNQQNKVIYYGLINNISTTGFVKKDSLEWARILNVGVRLVRIDNDMSMLYKP